MRAGWTVVGASALAIGALAISDASFLGHPRWVAREPGVGGIVDHESLSRIPGGRRGRLISDRIEIVGPVVSRRTS